MLLFHEIWYQLRNKGRSALLVLAAAALCGCMAFYVGNIRSTQKAMNSLSQTIPVGVQVTDHSASRSTMLTIPSKAVDALEAAEVHGLLCTAEAVGARSGEARAQDPFAGGDTTIMAANSGEALKIAMEVPEGFFSSGEAQCILSSLYSEEARVSVGDTVTLSIYSVARGDLGNIYTPVGEAALTVAGIYQTDAALSRPTDMYVPVGWLRAFFEENEKSFSYASCSALLNDPKELNSFKAALPTVGLMPPALESKVGYAGDSIVVDDELFIKTAGKLKQNLHAFQMFLLPVFGLILGLATLLPFLILRNSRREMAVAVSLGRSKMKIELSYFLLLLLADAAGCLLVLPAALAVGQVSFVVLLEMFGIFLLTAMLGAALALLLLLRFDAMELLTKVD